jgi:cyclase
VAHPGHAERDRAVAADDGDGLVGLLAFGGGEVFQAGFDAGDEAADGGDLLAGGDGLGSCPLVDVGGGEDPFPVAEQVIEVGAEVGEVRDVGAEVTAGTAPIEATLDYLRFVLDLAARGHAAGVSPLDAARDTDLGRFAGWPDAERIVGNLHCAYAELAGIPRGGPIDIPVALADMVAYNSGKPLTCLA